MDETARSSRERQAASQAGWLAPSESLSPPMVQQEADISVDPHQTDPTSVQHLQLFIRQIADCSSCAVQRRCG